MNTMWICLEIIYSSVHSPEYIFSAHLVSVYKLPVCEN